MSAARPATRLWREALAHIEGLLERDEDERAAALAHERRGRERGAPVAALPRLGDLGGVVEHPDLADDECHGDDRQRDPSRGVAPHSRAAWRKVSGAGLPGSPSALATRPSTTLTNRSAMPAAASTEPALADEETTARGIPRSRSRSSRATDPG